jgi:hypothetical protein
MRTGTNHFVSIGRANAYYFNLGFSFEDVQEKWKTKQIEIGKPVTNKLVTKDSDGRYWIEE